MHPVKLSTGAVAWQKKSFAALLLAAAVVLIVGCAALPQSIPFVRMRGARPTPTATVPPPTATPTATPVVETVLTPENVLTPGAAPLSASIRAGERRVYRVTIPPQRGAVVAIVVTARDTSALRASLISPVRGELGTPLTYSGGLTITWTVDDPTIPAVVSI